jgi:neutral ceramidase
MAGLEQKYPGMQAMFYMGCGSDQNPLPRRTVELCQKYGGMLASAVGDVLDKPMEALPPRLRVAFTTIDLPFGEQPTREQLEALRKKKSYEKNWAERLLRELDQGKPFIKSYPYPIQVWKLGTKQLWIVLGGEVVVDYALLFKAKYGPKTWVTGYANDVMSYIPSHRIWEEGRYEAGAFSVYGLPALRWCEDIQQRIMGSVDRLVGQVK